ncbi:hypothetical protein BaRGS_00028506, partial [Batillaria attramentaria]
FLPNFSKIAEPIIALTKKYARFQWSAECQRAFDFLKESLSVVPLLAYPDTSRPLPEGLVCQSSQEEAEQVKEVSDNSFEIGVVNSNEFTPKDFASFQPSGEPREKLDKIELAEFDMKVEQDKDPNLVQIRKQMQQENAPKMIRKRYLIIDDVLYFLSNQDDEPRARLVIPEHLILFVVRQYHDENGHMGIDKTYDTIQQKYFWTDMYRGLYEYVSGCVVSSESDAKTKGTGARDGCSALSICKAIPVNISETTQHSPFFLLYNRDPVLPLDNILRPRRKGNMKTAAVLLCLCIGLVEGSLGSHNVVFRKVNEVTTTRSRWLVTFIIDLEPYVDAMNRLSANIENATSISWQVVQHYFDKGDHFTKSFVRLNHDFKLVRETYNG